MLLSRQTGARHLGQAQGFRSLGLRVSGGAEDGLLKALTSRAKSQATLLQALPALRKFVCRSLRCFEMRFVRGPA